MLGKSPNAFLRDAPEIPLAPACEVGVEGHEVELSLDLRVAVAGVEGHRHVVALGLAGEPLKPFEDVGPGGLAVEQEPCLDTPGELASTAGEEGLADVACVGGGAVELQPLVGVVVDADGQHVERRTLARGRFLDLNTTEVHLVGVPLEPDPPGGAADARKGEIPPCVFAEIRGLNTQSVDSHAKGLALQLDLHLVPLASRLEPGWLVRSLDCMAIAIPDERARGTFCTFREAFIVMDIDLKVKWVSPHPLARHRTDLHATVGILDQLERKSQKEIGVVAIRQEGFHGAIILPHGDDLSLLHAPVIPVHRPTGQVPAVEEGLELLKANSLT